MTDRKTDKSKLHTGSLWNLKFSHKKSRIAAEKITFPAKLYKLTDEWSDKVNYRVASLLKKEITYLTLSPGADFVMLILVKNIIFTLRKKFY